MTLRRLEVTPFTEVIREILVERRTGRLTVIADPTRAVVFWSQGEIILAASSAPEDSLGRYLQRRDAIAASDMSRIDTDDPSELVPRLDFVELRGPATRNSLLRDWTTSIVVQLFSLEAGTTAFADEEALDPGARVFVSTPALVLEGTRQITSGLLLRTALGDLEREIQPNPEPPYGLGVLPLMEPERTVASALRAREKVGDFIKRFPGESVLAARVTISMLALGVYKIGDPRDDASNFDDTARDLALLASIGGDARALRAISMAKRLRDIDYYELLDVPRAATRAQIMLHGDEMRNRYDVSTYPEPVRPSVSTILSAIETAVHILGDVDKRHEYDRALSNAKGSGSRSVQQNVARHNLAIHNYRKAEELFVKEDFYGAIVLLREVTRFAPDFANGWHLLGLCQQKNPRWRRDAIESYQKALSIDPNQIDTMIALGDLYASQQLFTRARAFYEDVLKVDGTNILATSRLKKLAKG